MGERVVTKTWGRSRGRGRGRGRGVIFYKCFCFNFCRYSPVLLFLNDRHLSFIYGFMVEISKKKKKKKEPTEAMKVLELRDFSLFVLFF